MRSDPDAGVKRVANGIWKAGGGAPKLLKALAPALEKYLLKLRSGKMGAGVQKVACKVLDEQVEAAVLEAPTDAMSEAIEWVWPPAAKSVDADSAQIASGKAPEAKDDEADATLSGGRDRLASSAQDFIEANPDMASLPADVRRHCGAIAVSVIREGRRAKRVGKKIS